MFGGFWNLKLLCRRVRLRPLRKALAVIYDIYMYENSAAIAWKSKFAGRPNFPHGVKGIFVSGGARVGSNCTIFQQVTIGSNTLIDSGNFGAPVIGDDCYIGAGAKIVGHVVIGNNVRIAANATVYKNVPDNSVVTAGDQRMVTKHKLLDNTFYTRPGRWCRVVNGVVSELACDVMIHQLESKVRDERV